MFEFGPHNVSRSTPYFEREEPFAEWFTAENDPSSALGPLVVRLGENLERVFGAKAVDHAMQELVTRSQEGEAGWREHAAGLDHVLEWDLGGKLTRLAGYAVFGLAGDRRADAGQAGGDAQPAKPGSKAFLEEVLRDAEALLADCPVARWLPEREADKLASLVSMARGRWSIDHRRNVSPEALSLLGGVKMTRIRNMLSGAAPVLRRDEDGRVLYESAAAWLAKREEFLPTAYADDDDADEVAARETGRLLTPLFVPVARDGSVFHPGLARNGGYQVGPKDHERKVGIFEEALDLLQRMDVARWRRPSPNGNWGIVAATEWRRMERGGLDSLAAAAAT